MGWLERLFDKRKLIATRKATIPDGIWTKCDACDEILYRLTLQANLQVCPKCHHHMRMAARARLESFLDNAQRVEIASELQPKDVLNFKDIKSYQERLSLAQRQSGEKDALVVMQGRVLGVPVVACAFEFSFMAGSMGSVVGARFVSAVEAALAAKLRFGLLLRLWWRTNAGVSDFLDANGQNQCCPSSSF